MNVGGRVALIIAVCLSPSLAISAPLASKKFQVIHNFEGGADGEFPEAGLTFDKASGQFYGTTFGSLGGESRGKKCPKCSNDGTAYVLQPDGSLTHLHTFKAGHKDGAFPAGEVIVRDGAIYGTTEYGPGTACAGLGCGTVFSFDPSGTERVFNFCLKPNCADGAFPRAGLVAKGNGFFGVTIFGGNGSAALCYSMVGGCGTIYHFGANGKPGVKYSFCARAGESGCDDGALPLGKLAVDGAGNLYGTTEFGGAHSEGVIFRLSPPYDAAHYTVLYDFCDPAKLQNNVCGDGAMPVGGMVLDESGTLYGTTAFGGITTEGHPCVDNPDLGCGVVFRVDIDGVYTVLRAFEGETDGALPQAALITDGAGTLYGTTLRGGGSPYCTREYNGCGTIFSLAEDGKGYQTLYAFGLGKSKYVLDGAQPEGALVLYNNPESGIRSIYGVTRIKGKYGQGTACHCGTAYKLDLP